MDYSRVVYVCLMFARVQLNYSEGSVMLNLNMFTSAAFCMYSVFISSAFLQVQRRLTDTDELE